MRKGLTALCLLALPAVAGAEGIPLSTCVDTGAGRQSMLIERLQDRFVYFVEAAADEPAAFGEHVSLSVIGDCRGGWRLTAPNADRAAADLMHEVFFGETAYDRPAILALAKARGVTLDEEPFDAGHCACKVDPAGDTHLVDD